LYVSDINIFNNLNLLVYYKKLDCIAKKDINMELELEKSIKNSEDKFKNGFNELYKIYALNIAFKALCKFKEFSVILF